VSTTDGTPHDHPLRSPAWLVFMLFALALPIAQLVPSEWWQAAPPLPHLARLPDLSLLDQHGSSAQLHSGRPYVLDISAEPCGSPCAARTGVLAALAHQSSEPIALLTVLGAPPVDHPAQLASTDKPQWTVAWLPVGQIVGLTELHNAWVSARAHIPAGEFPTGGVMLIDASGSVRGIFEASNSGAAAAYEAWQDLQATIPDSPSN